MDITLPLKIVGVGRYLPRRVVPSSEVEALCGLPPGWIEAKSGVRERRWAGEGETSAMMGAEAAREAVTDAGLTFDAIDLILNASGSPARALPDGGPLIQRALGLGDSGIPCMSVHATCLSALMALDMSASLLASGRYRTILIVSSEIGSVGLNPAEPESASLLGDVAAAMVVTRTPPGEPSAVRAARFESFGEGADLTTVRGGGSERHPNAATTRPEDNLFHMDGPRVLRMSIRRSPPLLEALRPGLSRGLGTIKLVVPHQPSLAGIRVMEAMGWPRAQIATTLDWLGNCIAASLPATLYDVVRQGRLERGDEFLMVGSGAGLSLGGMILTY